MQSERPQRPPGQGLNFLLPGIHATEQYSHAREKAHESASRKHLGSTWTIPNVKAMVISHGDKDLLPDNTVNWWPAEHNIPTMFITSSGDDVVPGECVGRRRQRFAIDCTATAPTTSATIRTFRPLNSLGNARVSGSNLRRSSIRVYSYVLGARRLRRREVPPTTKKTTSSYKCHCR